MVNGFSLLVHSSRLGNMGAVGLHLGGRLVILRSKQELVKLRHVGSESLRNDAVSVLSDACLASGHREALGISDVEISQLSG